MQESAEQTKYFLCCKKIQLKMICMQNRTQLINCNVEADHDLFNLNVVNNNLQFTMWWKVLEAFERSEV